MGRLARRIVASLGLAVGCGPSMQDCDDDDDACMLDCEYSIDGHGCRRNCAAEHEECLVAAEEGDDVNVLIEVIDALLGGSDDDG